MVSAFEETPASRWFRVIRACPAPRLRLVCFPHAGGTANFFRTWARLMPDDAELLAVRYPGRADRLLEPPAREMAELSGPIADACADLSGAPLVFFGHSMGACVAFEVAARLRARPGGHGPGALSVSGRAGPGGTRSERLADTSDEKLIAELTAMSATTAEVLADRELRELVLPAVRADYRLIEDYAASAPTRFLDIPVLAYYGDQDDQVDEESVKTWSGVTGAGFTARSFPGGHHYLEQQAAALVGDLFDRLADLRPGGDPAPRG
ncbi:thioesterase II family protein [Streptomyces sp. NBC_01190]|uniref:thioesterase II family protein n=1 Tax=Streptomyces sp. NBC_01190 TaxID=2903767 RepID=UPI003865961A|nr:thioesterase domain-containing protein [Streptomyces sp. NBC_01190]